MRPVSPIASAGKQPRVKATINDRLDPAIDAQRLKALKSNEPPINRAPTSTSTGPSLDYTTSAARRPEVIPTALSTRCT